MAERIKRRSVLAGAGGAIVANALTSAFVTAEDASKVRQRAAIYIPQAPVGRQCSACRLFLPARTSQPAQCLVVEGPVVASGGCVLWEPRVGSLTGGGQP